MEGLGLIDREKETIEFIQKYEPPEGYYLGFSGGKDSVVLYSLAEKAKVKFEAYYSITGIDPPELIRFVREFYPDVKRVHPRIRGKSVSFFKLIPIRGPPGQIYRWCCVLLKERPVEKIKLKHRLLGIRAEESVRRKARGRISDAGSSMVYKPIFFWLTRDIWSYIHSNNIPYCKLYDEGFKRLGCVVCPFICGETMERVKRHKKRWPKHYELFEKVMKELWEQEKGEWREILDPKGEATFDTFIKWWYMGMPKRDGGLLKF